MADSREQMDRLLKQIEQEAYARGYAAAIAAVTAAANAAAPKAPESAAPESTPSNGKSAPEPVRGRGRPSTSIGSVRAAIFEKPGMKGVELVRYLEQRGTPVLERTVRSCLRRLNENKAIWQRKTRWYPKERLEAENSNAAALGAVIPDPRGL